MIGAVNPATIIVETIKPPPELQQPVQQQQQQLQPMPAPLIKQVQARSREFRFIESGSSISSESGSGSNLDPGLTFFWLCGSFLPSWIRIRIRIQGPHCIRIQSGATALLQARSYLFDQHWLDVMLKLTWIQIRSFSERGSGSRQTYQCVECVFFVQYGLFCWDAICGIPYFRPGVLYGMFIVR